MKERNHSFGTTIALSKILFCIISLGH